MNVYVIYDRYEHDEWYSVYAIETNKRRAIKKFKEECLPDFLAYGPDDCHSFQLQKVQMENKQYKRFCSLVENETSDLQNPDNQELKDMLIAMFDEDFDMFYEFETIFSTDGCSDNVEVVDFYIANYEITDPDESEYDDEDDYRYAVMEKLYNDNELYDEIIKEYIKINYR